MSAIEKATARPWRSKDALRDDPDGPHYRRYIAICPTDGNSVLAHVNLCAGNPLATNDAAGEANATLIVKAVNEYDALIAIAEAAQEFVDKCDRGEARSKRSYAAFKAGLDSLAKAKKEVA